MNKPTKKELEFTPTSPFVKLRLGRRRRGENLARLNFRRGFKYIYSLRDRVETRVLNA